MRRVAVLLNRNALHVTPELVRLVQSVAPVGSVFVTTTLDDGRAAAAAVARGGYEALCVGGGDGTFMHAVSDLLEVAPERVPVLMPLRLGTGNAISDVCGASSPTRDGLTADIARAASDEPPTALRLLDVDGRVTFFTGIGLDATYAEDHRRLIKDGLRKGRFGRLFDGVFGHALAAAIGTVPRLLLEPRPVVRIVNAGTAAYRLDGDGRVAGSPIPAGAVLYEGEVTIAAVSTISHYSSGIVFFPLVDRLRDGFQLRVSSAGLLQFLPHLPAVFAGTHRDPRTLWDFAATSVRFEMPFELPYHIGGDVQPACCGFTIHLDARSVPLLRLRAA